MVWNRVCAFKSSTLTFYSLLHSPKLSTSSAEVHILLNYFFWQAASALNYHVLWSIMCLSFLESPTADRRLKVSHIQCVWLAYLGFPLSPTLLLTFKLLALKVILEFCVTALMRGDLRRSLTISPLMDCWEKGEGEKEQPPFSLDSLFLTISPHFFSHSLFPSHFPLPTIVCFYSSILVIIPKLFMILTHLLSRWGFIF